MGVDHAMHTRFLTSTLAFVVLSFGCCLLSTGFFFRHVRELWLELEREMLEFELDSSQAYSLLRQLADDPLLQEGRLGRIRRDLYLIGGQPYESLARIPTQIQQHPLPNQPNKCPPGPTGPPGRPGFPGHPGLGGVDGIPGSPAIDFHNAPFTGCVFCPQGAAGVVGPVGKTGLRGRPGGSGVPGRPGKNGLQGAPGEMGPEGKRGEAGKVGKTGEAGENGKLAVPHKGPRV